MQIQEFGFLTILLLRGKEVQMVGLEILSGILILDICKTLNSTLHTALP